MRLLAAALVLLALAPTALADHAYSHRYLVLGRAVDPDGSPVANVTVDLDVGTLSVEGPCSNQPGSETDAFGPTRTNPVTNRYGEFSFCLHVHALSRGDPPSFVVRVPGHDVAVPVAADVETRATHVVVPVVAERGERADHYLVAGRAWRETPEPVTVEAIRVFGRTLDRVPVSIRVGDVGAETTTNNYGDFAVRVPFADGAPSGEVVVTIEDREFRTPVDPRHLLSYVSARFEAPAPPPSPFEPGVDPTPDPTPAAPLPTTEDPVATPTAAVPLPALVAIGALALAARRRR